jgi:hypothetical protein
MTSREVCAWLVGGTLVFLLFIELATVVANRAKVNALDARVQCWKETKHEECWK